MSTPVSHLPEFYGPNANGSSEISAWLFSGSHAFSLTRSRVEIRYMIRMVDEVYQAIVDKQKIATEDSLLINESMTTSTDTSHSAGTEAYTTDQRA
jgi:hypothetical protein